MPSGIDSSTSDSPLVLEQSNPTLQTQDCLPCRVVGAVALGTVGIYALHMSRAHQPGSIIGKRVMAAVGVTMLGLSALRAAGNPGSRYVATSSTSRPNH
ncbi:hypothetical protein K488DRAFT_46776 [Vararia minispora EC-137]|uniref:Uncharacterized protein n=1 Tax=Vararia minispora EC-137 TaxID=1314806 RepID=A0ACB8QQ13_9AGAM|nr:hypothetical protein K488DRAFT_46776 [Vararia minispora EC-137]